MKFSTQLSIASLVSLVAGHAFNLEKRDSPLKVELTATGNTKVNVALTNTGSNAVNLLNKGTLLDENLPVERVRMFSGSDRIPFEGIQLSIMHDNLDPSDFTMLAAGETKHIAVETAALHTLDDGGDFDVYAKGALPYAGANSTDLAGSYYYESNKLVLTVDGKLASKVTKLVSKRAVVEQSCSGYEHQAVTTALNNCIKLSTNAANAAVGGQYGQQFQTYFKTTSSSVRQTVAQRLMAVANDCSGRLTKTTANCDDAQNGCSSGVLAYTLPSQGFINYCPLFFQLPDLASRCHQQDKATTVIHEETHANAVYSPGTKDNGYGFTAATSLSPMQALNNADTYALYTNAIALNC